MAKRILLIEDDDAIGRLLGDNLRRERFDVEWSRTGPEGLEKLKVFIPDLIILDLMLPGGMDGFELCQLLSRQSPGPAREQVPIIILSARGQQADRVRGLNVGADDYVVKPFDLEEFLARIRAVLRRTKRTEPPISRLQLGKTFIDFRKLRASRGREELVLTDRQFEVLRYLAERAGSIVTREELLCLVWGYSQVPQTRTVDNFIFRLRQKIEQDPHDPTYIRTVYGDGYRLIVHG